MARPRKKRRIGFDPGAIYFKPRAIPLSQIQEVNLSRGELEAIRLVDFKGYSQNKASKKMNVSQSTLQRSLASARSKIAEALTEGKAIRVEDMLE